VICFNNIDEAYKAYENYYQLDIGHSFTDKNEIEDFYGNISKFDEFTVDLGRRCQNVSTGQHVEYVGTVATVRDMVALSDVLDGPNSSVNFWGMS
jgi:hypothetical protein